jgi:hypothetical protein
MTFAVGLGKSAATAEVHRTAVASSKIVSHREQYTSGDGYELLMEVVITRNTVRSIICLSGIKRGRHCSNDCYDRQTGSS